MNDHERRSSATGTNPATNDSGSRVGGGSTTRSLPARPSHEMVQEATPEKLAALAVQLKETESVRRTFDETPFGVELVQKMPDDGQHHASTNEDTKATAAQGVVGAGDELPFADRIQSSFGRHDVSDIQAHVGGDAATAATAIGAEAFATGHHVAFAKSPDLHTAAHEAAHVVQQRGGVQLKGGVGQAGDEYERHADAVADKVVAGESAEQLLDAHAHAAGGGDVVQRREEPASGPASGTSEMVIPKLIEFDDLEIGERQRRETILWNTGPTEARMVRSEVAIDKHQKQFQVRKLPDRIMPTSSPVAAKSGEIAIDFVPQGEGLRTDTLRLTIKTMDAQGTQRVYAIVLAGRGRQAGQPTHAKVKAKEREEGERDAKETADAEHDEGRAERTKRNLEDPRVAPTGRLEAFHARIDNIRDDIRTIDAKRAEGVSNVEKEADRFLRKPPPPTPSTWDYVREGAALALSFGSYGLAKGLAATLFSTGPSQRGPTGTGIGIGTDGQREPRLAEHRNIERAVEKALGKGAEWLIANYVKPTNNGTDAEAPSGSRLSEDPSIAFFSSQKLALANTSRARLGEITRLGPELVDQLHDESEFSEVLGILDAVRSELGRVAGTGAAEEQAQATAAQWLSFVSKRSGETHKVGANENALEAGMPQAELVSNLRPLDTRDGVIEIRFAADLKEPGEPVRIVGVRVLGVAAALAERIRRTNPAEVPLPIRAIGRDLTFGGQSIADPALAVTRNEAGQINVAAGKPGEQSGTNQQARYLVAKHAPERRHQQREADVAEGGRRVVEDEVFGQWSAVLGAFDDATARPKLDIETNDASKPKY